MQILDITPYSLFINVDGTQVNTGYPSAKLVDSFTLNNNIGIVDYQFSASNINPGGGNLVQALFLVVGSDAPVINVARDSRIFASYYMPSVGSAGTVVNTAFASRFTNYGIKVQAGMPMSLYASMNNNASEFLFGCVTLFTIYTK